MALRQWVRAVVLMLAVAVLAGAFQYEIDEGRKKKKRKPKKEPPEVTQVLELPKDPPQAVVAETRRITFWVTPLSSKGLLSQQTRDALKALQRQSGGASVAKIRAFVAGTGDLRRVPAIVSETFTEHKLSIPAVSVIQVGGLPMEGAQVVLEATLIAKKEVNPFGLAFISGQGKSSAQPREAAAPLARQSIENLGRALRGAGSEPSDVLRVTCFMTTLDDLSAVRQTVASAFPQAVSNFVAIERSSPRSLVECEAVARLRQGGNAGLELRNPEGLPASPSFSQVALVSAPKLLLTSTQIAFGFQDSDARLAFQRLQKVLEQNGTSLKANVAFSSIYPLSPSLAEQVRRIRFEFYDKARPPASTLLVFDGLPGMDAGFAVEVAAVLQ
jgi:enamine deaminase RidA (YjgF/YER057c/UK114 family)